MYYATLSNDRDWTTEQIKPKLKMQVQNNKKILKMGNLNKTKVTILNLNKKGEQWMLIKRESWGEPNENDSIYNSLC